MQVVLVPFSHVLFPDRWRSKGDESRAAEGQCRPTESQDVGLQAAGA